MEWVTVVGGSQFGWIKGEDKTSAFDNESFQPLTFHFRQVIIIDTNSVKQRLITFWLVLRGSD